MSPDSPDAIEVLLFVVDVLDELGVGYHVGGSYASSVHGTPRQTQDVDIVAELGPSRAALVVERLGDAFYADAEPARRAATEGGSFNVLHLETGVKVDVFCLGGSPFDRSEFDRAIVLPVFGAGGKEVRVKSAEDTILRKLRWFRDGGEVSDRQWADVVGCLRAAPASLDDGYLEMWSAELGVRDLLERAKRESG